MRDLSEKYKELALRAGRYPRIRMELYEGGRNQWTDVIEKEYNGDNAIISAIYTNGLNTAPDTFEIGNAYIGLIEMELSGETYTELESGKRFKVFTGFIDPETRETAEAAVGEFFIESISIEKGVTHIKARDKLLYTENKFDPSQITYPCSLTELLREVIRQAGFSLPEGYTLAIDPQVTAAPLMKLPNNFKYLMSDGTELDGRPYSCRQILGEIAKMQLGNCFADGDGNIRFSSYTEEQTEGDHQITSLDIGSEKYKTWVLLYQNDTESGETQQLEENVYGTIYYTTFIPSEKPDFTDQFDKIKDKYFYRATIEKKGVGEAEIGDFIDYSGRYGEKRFFVFGVQYEWRDASFDETLYSFAPTYEQASLSSDNVKTPASQIESNAEVGESGGSGGTIYSSGAGISISGSVISARIGEGLEYDNTGRIKSVPNIQNAVLITEADAKYLLHSFTEIEYNAGNRIGYAGPGNQIVVQGYLAYQRSLLYEGMSSKDANNTYVLYPDGWSGSFSRYLEFDGDFYVNTNHYTKLSFGVYEANVHDQYIEYKLMGNGTANIARVMLRNYYRWSGFGLVLDAVKISPPGAVYEGTPCEFGFVNVRVWSIARIGETISGGTKWYQLTWLVDGMIPFASLAEYQAAVGLTYEPLTLTEVVDNPTVVSGKDIGEGVT